MNTKNVSIAEFLHLTRLKADDVVWMLENGELPIEVGPTRELLVDLTKINPDDIAHRTKRSAPASQAVDPRLTAEMVASEIVSGLDTIVDDALALATTWLANRGGQSNSS